jgi:hypothetical protein
MHQYLVNTKKKPCTVNFNLATDVSEVPIYIVGKDFLNANTLYFRSRFRISGNEEVNLNCPQSPVLLKIMVWSENDLPYELSSVTVTPLDVAKSIDPSICFIEIFSRICGRLRPGNYVSDNIPFTIEFKRNIYTDDGRVHPTPARIHTELPIIQVSEAKFNFMTIPERVIILLHEVSHNFINSDQDDEKEADDNAKIIYNQLGYPQIESVNAFGNIMSDTDNNIERMYNLVNN